MTGPSEHRAETAEWHADYGEEGYFITNGVETFGMNQAYGRPERLVAILNADHRRAAKAERLAKALVSRCWYCKRGYPLGPTHVVKTAEQWAERAGTEWKNMNTGGKSFDEFYPDGVEDGCDLNDEQRAALAEQAEVAAPEKARCPHCGATTVELLENGAIGCSTCFKMWEP